MEQIEIESRFTYPSHFKDGVIDLSAGTIAGIANVYAGQPLDTVKVKMQVFPKLYESGIKCFRETYRLDGIKGLYAGTVPALTANIAENAVLFTAYGYCQKFVAFVTGHPDIKHLSPVESAISGSLASIFAALVLCPTELVKCRLQAQREVNPNIHSTPLSICRQMYRDGGVRSFFVGLSATLCREIPGYFFFFGAYDLTRYYLTPKGKSKQDLGIIPTAFAGGVGGLALWTAVYPIDLVKSRVQIAGTGNFGQILLKICRNEGIRALYKGIGITLVRAWLATGCLFVSYENSKKFFSTLL